MLAIANTDTPGKTMTVLIMEDEKIVREVLKRILERMECKVIEAGDGEEGLAISNSYEDTIDLIISDIVMPKKDGKKAVQEILETRTDTRVIYITGFDEEAIQEYGDANMVSNGQLLRKPFTIQDIRDQISDVISIDE